MYMYLHTVGVPSVYIQKPPGNYPLKALACIPDCTGVIIIVHTVIVLYVDNYMCYVSVL